MNVSSSTGYPAPERPDAAALFRNTDANGDGHITQKQLTTALETRAQETGKSDGPGAEDLFTQLDADGDGEITATEHAAGLAGMESQGGMRPAPPPSSEEGADLIDVLAPLLDQLAAQDAAKESPDATDSQATLDALIEQLMAELKSRGDATNLYEAEA